MLTKHCLTTNVYFRSNGARY